MDESPKPEKPSGESLWPAILFVGGVLLVSWIASELDKDTPGAGRTFFAWTIGVCAIILILWMFWGKTAGETARNIAGFAKSVAIFLVVALVLGGIGECTGISSRSDIRDTGGVPDQWRK